MTRDKHVSTDQQQEMQTAMSRETNPPESGNQHDTSPGTRNHRRRLLQAVTAAGLGGAATLPTQWSRPVVDSVLLPAHAQATPDPFVCEVRCTRFQSDYYEVGLNGIGGYIITEEVHCVSQNGAVSSSSGSTLTTIAGGTTPPTAFSQFTSFTGTFSTIATLEPLYTVVTTAFQSISTSRAESSTLPC